VSWQRAYIHKRSLFVPIFIGVVLAFIGLIFVLLFGPLGALVLAGAVVVPGLVWYLGEEVTVTCGDQGFHVRSRGQRQGLQESTYGWSEVTATTYHEPGRRDRTTGYLTVDTVRGRTFTMQNRTPGFGELVEVFNAMTTHLPFIWQARTGFAVSVGPLSVGRSAYARIPRAQQQPQ
jgi:hypothetical protein